MNGIIWALFVMMVLGVIARDKDGGGPRYAT